MTERVRANAAIGYWELQALRALASRQGPHRRPQPPRLEDSPNDGDPVDVVYTWVDGNDPAWLARRRAYEPSAAVADDATAKERFLNLDELRYSLRSIDRFAPFARRIYVVTADQVPACLDLDHPRVTVVAHSEIFPDPAVLPTFSARPIEACLHRIPGLSRHFVYVNDDVFVGAPVDRSTFFDDAGGLIVRRRSTHTGMGDATATDSHFLATRNAAEHVRDAFGTVPLDTTLAHTPHALDRDLMYEAEQRFPEAFRDTRASRFRAPTDVSTIPLAIMLALATGRATLRETSKQEYIHATLGNRNIGHRLRQIEQVRPMFYCLNASPRRDVSLPRQARILRTFLEKMLPTPSEFEAPVRRPRQVDS